MDSLPFRLNGLNALIAVGLFAAAGGAIRRKRLDPLLAGAGAGEDVIDESHQPVDGLLIDGMLHAAGGLFGRGRIDFKHVEQKVAQRLVAVGDLLRPLAAFAR